MEGNRAFHMICFQLPSTSTIRGKEKKSIDYFYPQLSLFESAHLQRRKSLVFFFVSLGFSPVMAFLSFSLTPWAMQDGRIIIFHEKKKKDGKNLNEGYEP